MPSQISDQQLSEAVYHAVQDGAYPEDEAVVSAELPSSAFDNLQALLEKARAEVKTSIRELSRISAPDIDGWISQAKQLRADIDSSETLAQEVVGLADEGHRLQAQFEDASGKLELLKGEVDFNEHLLGTLQQVYGIRTTLDTAQQAVLDNDLPVAIALLKKADRELSELQGCDNTRLAGLIRAKCADLQKTVADNLTEQWNILIHVDVEDSSVSIKHDVQEDRAIDVSAVVAALSALNLLNGKVLALRKSLEEVLLKPRLVPDADGTVASWSIDGNTMRISGRTLDASTKALFQDMSTMVGYLSTHLPQSIAVPLSEALLPSLTSRLVVGPLSFSVPPDLNGIPSFKATLDQITAFEKSLTSHGWHGRNNLTEWANDAPKVWLTRRSESALHTIRSLLVRGLGDPRTVERVETQMVTKEDDMFMDRGNNEDWNAGWSDEDEPKSAKQAVTSPNAQNGTDEEEDVSAWGLDDEEDNNHTEASADEAKPAGDEGDAWGWGDENDNDEPAKSPRAPTVGVHTTRRNGGFAKTLPTERQVTLRETYNITALPEQILEAIIEVVSDADTLARSNPVDNPVTSAAEGLYALPGLLLSMYRAIAPNFYAQDISGNMFLYNDSLYMAEQLRQFASHHASRSSHYQPSDGLASDISALELFGKRAYGKEMESQRTILSDLLDGAQGFANCTEPPFAAQCDLAISSTVDRLRDVHKQWKPVLSHSALLQSIGSLLGTVINKIILDIEDMGDISEPESQRLTAFCNRVVALEDLFLPEHGTEEGGVEQVPRTAVYTPHWLKFQYLANILESSLVDIKYLWAEAELSLEFGKEELVDLIEALFADSEHRRRAIGEIKRGAKGS